jgi:hypothetical protein
MNQLESDSSIVIKNKDYRLMEVSFGMNPALELLKVSFLARLYDFF